MPIFASCFLDEAQIIMLNSPVEFAPHKEKEEQT